MENLPSILTPDLGLLFWMLLAFLVVFGVLAKFGFPAIVGMVEERKKFIDESLKRAHEAAERLTNIQQESEAIVQQARVQQAADDGLDSLKYQLEYIISGKYSDRENEDVIIDKLLLIREGLNLLFLLGDNAKRQEAYDLALQRDLQDYPW